MNQKEAEKIIIDYINPIFIERGFIIKKKYGGFVKLYNDGYDRVPIGMYSYWPLQSPTYAISRRFNIVEDIYKSLSEKFNFVETITPIDYTFWFSEDSLQGQSRSANFPAVETESEMLNIAKHIKEFMLETGFPMLEKYSTLQAIDETINGENFWDDDWMHPFTLGGGVIFKRLIIAKLSNSVNYEKIKNYHLSRHLEARKNAPEKIILMAEGKSSLEYLVEVLLKEVKPIES